MTVFFHMSYKLNIYVKRFLSDDPTARFGSDFFCRGSKIILLLFYAISPLAINSNDRHNERKCCVVFLERENQGVVSSVADSL